MPKVLTAVRARPPVAPLHHPRCHGRQPQGGDRVGTTVEGCRAGQGRLSRPRIIGPSWALPANRINDAPDGQSQVEPQVVIEVGVQPLRDVVR